MAMSVTYVTVHGRLREETRGGVTTRYLGDTLGSVIKTTDTSGNVTSTTTYWPFGEVRSQTGTNPSPWGFCGVWGYLTDAASRMYVRARHYRADTSRWLSVDPLWPDESAYGYADNAPIDNFDPEGTWVIPVACASACLVTAGCAAGVWIACGSLWGTSDFDDCAKDYIESLPPISKIGCGVGLLGCLACIVYYLRGRVPPVRPTPTPAPPSGPVPVPRLPAPTPRPIPRGPCGPRVNPGFPKGRWYQNCMAAFMACWNLHNGHRRCWDCLQTCRRNGMRIWLTPKCAFWDPGWRGWGRQ
ncbi:MAG: RHS repeat domain-containing protein [Armatimonadota bacterium]|jgi:RHS repeat-associated protein